MMRSISVFPIFTAILAACVAATDLFQQGNAFYQHGNLDEAENAYRRFLSEHPRHFGCMCNLASLYDDTDRRAEAQSLYTAVIQGNPNHSGALFNLAMILQDQNELAEAAKLYVRVLQLDPNSLDATSNLAACCHQLGLVWEAVDYYKKAITLTDPRDSNLLAVLYEHLGRSLLRLPNDDVALKEEIITAFSTALEHDPSNDIARHLLSSQHQQGGEENPPESFIRRLFDDYAHNFEQSLASLNYSAPRLISEYLSQYTSMSWGCVIDLGCGSGLMAELLKNHTQGIVGIDLSPKMLFVAEEKNLYNMLIVGDMVGLVDELIAYRNDTGPSRSVGENRGVRRKMSGSKVLELDMVRQDNGFAWDEIIVGQKSLLVVAADVLVYVGSLDQLFTSVGRLLRPGDHFAFTVEALHVEGEFSWLLQSSGRFAHRQEYLEHLSKQHGFGILALDAVTPRKEKGEDVRGYVVLLEKN